MAKKVSNKNKATATTGVAGMAGALGTLAAVKYGVPLEITVPVVGAVLGFLGRWAAKLNPQE